MVILVTKNIENWRPKIEEKEGKGKVFLKQNPLSENTKNAKIPQRSKKNNNRCRIRKSNFVYKHGTP